MTLSAIHNNLENGTTGEEVVCDIGGYDFVSYSQQLKVMLTNMCGCL